MNKIFDYVRTFVIICFLSAHYLSVAQIQHTNVLNEPPDISDAFSDYRNTFYLADELVSFDPETARGSVRYLRYNLATRQAFDNMLSKLNPSPANEFPTTEYEASPELPFSIQFVSERTIRIKMSSGPQFHPEETSLMLVSGKAPDSKNLWTYTKIEGGHQYKSGQGAVVIREKPWHVEIYNASGKLLTSTLHLEDVPRTLLLVE